MMSSAETYRRGDPLLQVTKCDMCPQRVTNFVVGLCDRCVAIWTNRRRLDMMHITMDHVRAAIVSMSRSRASQQNMSSVFRRVIEEEQMRRKHKVDMFQRFREKFQDGVLLPDLEEATESRHVPELYSNEITSPDEDWMLDVENLKFRCLM